MSKEAGIALAKLKSTFIRQPYPTTFSRIVSVLLTYVDPLTKRAWPSQQRLAMHVGCSEKTIKRNLEAARNLGLLTVESVDAEEMRRRVPTKKKLPPHHRFTIYTIEADHPLWRADEEAIRAAKAVIQKSTHRGVNLRCDRRRAKEIAEAA